MMLIIIGVVLLVCVLAYVRIFLTHPVDTNKDKRLGIVITGASKGLGYAMAKEFVTLHDNVVISSRSEERLVEASKKLQEYAKQVGSNSKISYFVCDVSKPDDSDSLADFAASSNGPIDLWINNAGISQNVKAPLIETDTATLQSCVETNLLGTLFGCRAALRVMLKQENGGHVFNVDGAGSRGNHTANTAVYGCTKAAVPQLGKSLSAELKSNKNVGVHTLSPGMVMTDLLLEGNRTKRTLKIFNILAELPSTTAEWLVPRVRAVAKSKKSGAYIRYLTMPGVIWRFLTFWNRKNRLINVDEAVKSDEKKSN
eukprot:m.71337 g.71337  ORF g.71337 m.71337 type:complete len:313 (+) comp12237_c0_seq3:189-1127(+)